MIYHHQRTLIFILDKYESDFVVPDNEVEYEEGYNPDEEEEEEEYKSSTDEEEDGCSCCSDNDNK